MMVLRLSSSSWLIQKISGFSANIFLNVCASRTDMEKLFKFKHEHKHNMPFKTITIKESAYRKLKAAKRKDESFTDLIERKFKEKPDLMKYAGILTDEEAEEAWNRTLEFRKAFNEDAERRRKDVLSRLRSSD